MRKSSRSGRPRRNAPCKQPSCQSKRLKSVEAVVGAAPALHSSFTWMSHFPCSMYTKGARFRHEFQCTWKGFEACEARTRLSVRFEEPSRPSRHLIANPALLTGSVFSDVSLVLFPLLHGFVYQFCAFATVHTSQGRAAMQVDMKQYRPRIFCEKEHSRHVTL